MTPLAASVLATPCALGSNTMVKLDVGVYQGNAMRSEILGYHTCNSGTTTLVAQPARSGVAEVSTLICGTGVVCAGMVTCKGSERAETVLLLSTASTW